MRPFKLVLVNRVLLKEIRHRITLTTPRIMVDVLNGIRIRWLPSSGILRKVRR